MRETVRVHCLRYPHAPSSSIGFSHGHWHTPGGSHYREYNLPRVQSRPESHQNVHPAGAQTPGLNGVSSMDVSSLPFISESIIAALNLFVHNFPHVQGHDRSPSSIHVKVNALANFQAHFRPQSGPFMRAYACPNYRTHGHAQCRICNGLRICVRLDELSRPSCYRRPF